MSLSGRLNFTGRRHARLMRQTEASECGLACVGMVASYWGYSVDISTLRREHQISARGASLNDIMRIASQLGLNSRPVRCELSDLPRLQTPAILHWDMKHFVVLVSATKNRAVILDPSKGEQTYRLTELDQRFTGVAVEVKPSQDFRPRDERHRVQLRDLVRPTSMTWRALRQGLALSILLQIFIIATPMLMQLLIDQAVGRSDFSLLVSIIVGLTLLKTFELAANALRALVFQFASSVLLLDMRMAVFRHLLRLPLQYFHKRHVGDVLQRFAALHPIGDFVVNGTISAVVDGVLAVSVAALLFIYNASIGMIVVGGLSTYLIFRIAFLIPSIQAANSQIDAQARESSNFLETLRSMQTLKAAGIEHQREVVWHDLAIAQTNANIRAGNLGIAYSTVSQAVLGFTTVIAVYVMGLSVMDESITIGAMTAMIAYKAQLEQRAIAIIELYLRYRLLSVNLERVSDILLEPTEQSQNQQVADFKLEGELHVRELSFRYSSHEKDVFTNISLTALPGDLVAITGQSGAGKSTLLKVLAGLYQPTGGTISFGGGSVDANASAGRPYLGIILQDDTLLSGTILDNISMFDPTPDLGRIEEVASLACIHDDISKMAMRYHTLVGDMGSTLSGGQQQRILIARALYRRPKLLFLDEATAHLDVSTEARVIHNLRMCRVTCIFAAHRPEMIAASTKVLHLSTPREMANDSSQG